MSCEFGRSMTVSAAAMMKTSAPETSAVSASRQACATSRASTYAQRFHSLTCGSLHASGNVAYSAVSRIAEKRRPMNGMPVHRANCRAISSPWTLDNE